MIKNIVFDMGNVLMRFDAEAMAAHFAPDPADARALLDGIFRSKEWLLLDENVITEAEFEASLPARLPARLLETGRQAFRKWHLLKSDLPDGAALVNDLKRAGYKLYLLSNASLRWDVYWRDSPAMAALDGHIVSAHVNCVKPDPAIYRILFATYALKPAECYFIDDMAANIEAGRRLGMEGFVLDRFQYDELRADLRAKGVRI